MTLPFRMVQAKATAAAEQPCAAPIRERGVAQQRTARSPKRRVGHHWYRVLRTPWQQVMFNGAVTETVGNLIGCAAITMRNI